MSEAAPILVLQDLDLMQAELGNPLSLERLRKLGLPAPVLRSLERARNKVLAKIDRRWLVFYDRASSRYGRPVAIVRDRVCQGCFITLPTSASPAVDESLTLCESCGRILYWG